MPKAAAHGRFVWHDLATPNPDAAKSFYSQIAPWETKAWDDDVTDYTMWTLDGKPIGGVTPLESDPASAGLPPHWMAYVSV